MSDDLLRIAFELLESKVRFEQLLAFLGSLAH